MNNLYEQYEISIFNNEIYLTISQNAIVSTKHIDLSLFMYKILYKIYLL